MADSPSSKAMMGIRQPLYTVEWTVASLDAYQISLDVS